MAVIMRFCDVMLSFPAILLALLIDGILRVIPYPENRHDQAAYGVLQFVGSDFLPVRLVVPLSATPTRSRRCRRSCEKKT